jgi:Transposase IS116/IS110/IS902 family
MTLRSVSKEVLAFFDKLPIGVEACGSAHYWGREIAALDKELMKENKASELGPRLETVSSVGPVIASALRARVTDAKLFANGRHLSVWIGLVPENDSTGGKVKQKGLSKKGDDYLRSLLVNGAMGVVRQAQKRPDKHPWVAKLFGRMSAKRAASAIANKTADRPGPHGAPWRLRGLPSRTRLLDRAWYGRTGACLLTARFLIHHKECQPAAL